MTIPRNLSFLAQGASSTGLLGVPNGGTGLSSFTTGQIHFGSFSTSSNLFWDNTNNRLGLGTSSPAQALHVSVAGSAYIEVQNTTNSVTAYFGADTAGQILQSGASNPIKFLPQGVEAMRIHASTGVSIGNTTDPGASNLSVSGTVLTQGYTVATLPTGVTGARAYVTNALAPTFGSTVVGGGTVTIPVFYNGTNWVVG